jgi:hypothetical protein
MSYVTVEVEIDHGRIVPREPAKLPERGKGLLTVLEDINGGMETPDLSPIEAFHALQKSLALDDAKAKEWMNTMRDARR